MRLITTLLLNSVLIILVSGCQNGSSAQRQQLRITIIDQGTGEKVEEGDQIRIKEETRYPDGTLLFDTDDIGGSIAFQVGANQVIEGLDLGVIGMQVGEVREIFVPSRMAWRSEYPDFIHPDSSLVYLVELLEIIDNYEEQ